MESIPIQVDVDVPRLLVRGHAQIVDSTVLHVAEVEYAHLLALGHEERVQVIDVNVSAVLVEPHVAYHARRIVMQHAGTDKRERNYESLRETVPKTKD